MVELDLKVFWSMMLVAWSWVPFHSERAIMARISLYHLTMPSWFLLDYFGKLVEEGPLIYRALIYSARVSRATFA